MFWRCTKVLSKFQLVFCCILTKITKLWNPKSNRKLQYSFLQAFKNIFYLFVFQKLRLKLKKSREEKLFGILFILLLRRRKNSFTFAQQPLKWKQKQKQTTKAYCTKQIFQLKVKFIFLVLWEKWKEWGKIVYSKEGVLELLLSTNCNL